jgi:hypothetical protein
MARHSPHILELARRGAEVQLRDLVQEIRYLMDLFPHLRDSFNEGDLPVGFIMSRAADQASKAGTARRRRRRGTLSDEAGKAVGARAKKDWSARRKAKKT